ncbi:formylglycine-generating enzyme family protein [Halobaculum marinum]|uniref:Formylglycine-generating enzyme family protein n=1 Tax=Halobaculum marinum TaxID=3031996 RepID=A0ABD5X3F9_9EURY
MSERDTQDATPETGVDDREPPDDGMVRIPGGTFAMGSEEAYPEEAPVRDVAVDGFWMDATHVTNAAFAAFVDDTGYTTIAERDPDPDDYPGVDPADLVAGSAVFRSPDAPVNLREPSGWWEYVPGADWRHPLGPDSDLDGLADHPVVHVAYEDAERYAEWAGKRLPTEAEWERAARGGLDGARFVWGDEHAPDGEPMGNTWQGQFPYENKTLDGYHRTSPVGAFPANEYGLYDVAGNVWDWTADWYGAGGDRGGGAAGDAPACCTPRNPRGVTAAESVDPRDPTAVPRKVLKGGSHLCAPNYCFRYRPSARYPEPVDTSTSHVGFRCVAGGGGRDASAETSR